MPSLVALADRFLPPARRAALHEVGLLLFRLGIGLGLALGHGWEKLSHFHAGAATFPDPIGLGGPLSYTLVMCAEFFAALAVAAGFLTRLAAIPPIIAMAVAGLVVHSHDPWKVKELAFFYLFAFVCVALLGPGEWSLDARLRRTLGRRSGRVKA
jgi:putative oxidoreductase